MNKMLFSSDHLWVSREEEVLTVGITEYALKKMRTVVFITLPEEGDEVVAGESFGDIESLKTVSELISPLTGTVSGVNTGLADDPETLSAENNWLFTVEGAEVSEGLMNAKEYEEFIKNTD